MESETLKQALLLFIAFLGIFWSILLFTHKRGRKDANRFLGLLMLILSLHIMMRGSYSEPLRDYFVLLLFVSHGLAFWIGPAILLHIRIIAGKSVEISSLYRHFTAGLVFSLLGIVGFFFRKDIMNADITSAIKIGFILFLTSQIVHLVSYIIISRKEVNEFEKRLTNYYSSTDKISLIWIKQLTVITAVFAFIVLGMQILIVTGGYYHLNNTADFLYLFLIAGIVLTIVIKSWQRPEIYSQMPEDSMRYKDAEIPKSIKNDLEISLNELIQEDKIFTTAELKLKDLAEQLNTQPYILSQFLNTQYNKNFFHFINDLRIEEAEHRLKSGYLIKETIAGLAYEVGFNSKSTFNRAFKKKTGLTPTQFVKTDI